MKKIPERKADTSMEKDKNKMENKKLAELLEHLEYELVQGTLDREIPAVVYDSRKVVPGCLFLCIGGANFDGHDFAAQVAEQGAGVLVVQKDVELPENVDVTVVKVADTRYAMAFLPRLGQSAEISIQRWTFCKEIALWVIWKKCCDR